MANEQYWVFFILTDKKVKKKKKKIFGGLSPWRQAKSLLHTHTHTPEFFLLSAEMSINHSCRLTDGKVKSLPTSVSFSLVFLRESTELFIFKNKMILPCSCKPAAECILFSGEIPFHVEVTAMDRTVWHERASWALKFSFRPQKSWILNKPFVFWLPWVFPKRADFHICRDETLL